MARSTSRSRRRRRQRLFREKNQEASNWKTESPTMHVAAVQPIRPGSTTVLVAAVDWIRDSVQLVSADLSGDNKYSAIILFCGHKMMVTVQQDGQTFRLIDLRW